MNSYKLDMKQIILNTRFLIKLNTLVPLNFCRSKNLFEKDVFNKLFSLLP